MNFRNIKEEEVSQLRSLWNICFGDPFSYIDFYIQNGYIAQNTFVCVINGMVVSMITMIPAVLNIRGKQYCQGGYLYAIATHPDFRGQGCMKKLEAFVSGKAKERNFQFLFLVPASDSLFRMYEKIGYQTYSCLSSCDYLIEPCCCEQEGKDNAVEISLKSMGCEEFLQKRGQWLENFPQVLDLSEQYRSYSYQEMKRTGCEIISVEGDGEAGYLVYYIQDGQLYIRETAMELSLFNKIVCLLFQRTKATSMHVKTRYGWKRCRTDIPYSMIKLLDDKIVLAAEENTYVNLMLD